MADSTPTLSPSPTLDNSTPTPVVSTVKMQNPSGELGDVPEDKVSAASLAGYSPVVQMTNPNGEVGYVPTHNAGDALKAGYKYGAAIKDTSTISAPKPTTAGSVLDTLGQVITNPIAAAEKATEKIENYTPEGRAEHPVLSRIGDLTRGTKELLEGGQAAGKPMGTSSGVVNNPVTQAIALAPDAANLGAEAEDAVVGKLANRATAKQVAKLTSRAAKGERAVFMSSDGAVHSVPVDQLDAARSIDPNLTVLKPEGEITKQHFTKLPEGSIPQHGSPVPTVQPLDRATVDHLAGGKDLSPEAFDTLKKHVGGPDGQEIEAGSNAKNILHRVSAPVQKTLTDTGLKMNDAIQKAPAFQTSTIQDGASDILKDIDAVRDTLPLKLNDPLNKVIDTQLEAAYPALESKDPSEILAYRRKIGQNIDWSKLTTSPETSGEAKDMIQAKIYKALGDKLHNEIPEVAKLDEIFQPNLELQKFLEKNGVSRNPVEANAEYLSELGKGKRKLMIDAHNAKVDRNINLAKKLLYGVGLGGAVGLGVEARHLIEP